MKKNITINVEMEERWISHFCSMLKYMQDCGNLGHSSIVGFYSDGDGDFRPKFEFSDEFKFEDGYKDKLKLPQLEVLYDAG